jgi:hypothetical protein
MASSLASALKWIEEQVSIKTNFITFTMLYLRVYKSENEMERGLRG